MAKQRTTRNTNLRSKFRFVVLNDETFEEKFALTLTRLNVWLFLSTVGVVLVALTASAIIYTPLKYFIPGFGDYNYRSQILNLEFQADSLEEAMNAREIWLENVNNVISGKSDSIEEPKSELPKNYDPDLKNKLGDVSDAEKNLRKEMEEKESFSLSYDASTINQDLEELKQLHFIAPANGILQAAYSPEKEQYGITLLCAKDEPVKAVYDGTVIGTGFSVESGYYITIQHANDLISIYKHCGQLLKKTGSAVKAGDAIAIVNNAGSTEKGPVVGLELWRNGRPVNPALLMVLQ
jgi:murein DD-endopeptidase MepM/ murein hydrolase activator NlpD